MRKLLIISLLLLVFSAQLGYYFVFNTRQENAREEVRERMEAGLSGKELQLVILEDNKDQLVWKEWGHEFYLNNTLYDIARAEKHDGKTYLYCINDTKEKELVAGFSKLINSTQHENGKAARHTIKFEMPEYLPIKLAAMLLLDFTAGFSFPGYSARLYTVPAEIQSPPPQV